MNMMEWSLQLYGTKMCKELPFRKEASGRFWEVDTNESDHEMILEVQVKLTA